jgi:hypothetical protein
MPSARASLSEPEVGTLVVVQQEWNGWRKAMAPLYALEGVHWHQPHGAPKPLIHAWVPCSALQSGDIPHDCAQAPSPHRLLVCVLKCHTGAAAFDALVALADANEENDPARLVQRHS